MAPLCGVPFRFWEAQRASYTRRPHRISSTDVLTGRPRRIATVAHDINNLHLDLREDKQELGILAGFFHGTYEFCCKCKGFLGLWCPNDLSTIEKINKYKNKDASHQGDSIAGNLYKPFKNKVSTTDEDLDDV